MANVKIAAPRLNGQSVTIAHNGASRTVFAWAVPIVAALGGWSLRVPDFEYEYVTEDNGSVTFSIMEPTALATEINITKTQLEKGPVNVIQPSLSGSIAIGQTITVDPRIWASIETPTPSYAFRYFRNGVVIGGATSSTYQTVQADAGAEITAGVIATDANGSSIEVISAPFIPRATPWTQTNVQFDGASMLQINSGLYVDPDEPIEQGGGADSILLFASGVTSSAISEEFLFHISGNSYLKFNATSKALNFSSIGWEEGTAGSLFGRRTDNSNPADFPIAGKQFSILCHVRRDSQSPGSILLRICYRLQGGDWVASAERNATGPQIEANSGILTLGARENASSGFNGSMTRVAAWTNIDPDLFIGSKPASVDVPNRVITDLFMANDSTLVDPTISQAFLGQPRFDFNGSLSDWQNGIHDGTMPNFTRTGTLT